MGEWTIHIDTPEGTSLEGTTEIALQLLKELSGIDGRRQIEPSIGVTGPRAADPHPFPRARRCRSSERKQTQAQIDRRDAPAAGRAPGLPAEHHRAQCARRRRRQPAASRSRRTSSAPDLTSIADYSMKALAEAQQLPSLAEPEDRPEHLEPGDSRRRRSPARRRSRRAHGDDRQHAAARGGRRRRDLELQGRAGAVSGEDPRAREPAPRRRGDRPAHRAVGRTAPVRIDNIAQDRARPRTEHAAALQPAVHGQPDRRRRARATRSTRRRTTSARCSPA